MVRDSILRTSPRFKELTKLWGVEITKGKKQTKYSSREITEDLTDFLVSEDLDKVFTKRMRKRRY